MVRVAFFSLLVGLAVGCGGMSLDDDGGAGGKTGGSGGKTGGAGGSGGKGGTTGGTGASGGTTGGVGGNSGGVGGSTGGTTGGVGGSMPVTGGVGGSTGGVGGSMPVTGGVGGSTGGVGGVGGTAGAGSVCDMPLVTGPCDAYFVRYGYNATTGACEKFVYGGCEGNENNFESLAECQAACPAPSSDCPPTVPTNGSRCEGQSLCSYHPLTGCLCADGSIGYPCQQADPSCTGVAVREVPAEGSAGACSGSDCTEEIVIPPTTDCTCDTSSEWFCNQLFK